MPSKQRENARKEKQLLKEQKIRRIIWIVIVLVVACLIVMKAAELDYGKIKSYFTDKSISMTTEADAYPYTLDSSAGVKLNFINDKIVALTDLSCTVLNPSDAKEIYSFSHGYSNPITSCAGNYIFTIDQGGTRLRLDNTSENVYESKLETTVICADVAKNGNAVYAVRKSGGKQVLIVMNSSLKKLMNVPVTDGYVVAVAIDPSGRKCAYATVSSKNAKLVTTVHTINVGETEDKASFDFKDSNVFDLQYSNSGELYYVGTNAVAVVKNQKHLKEVFKTGSVYSVTYNYTSDNELVYVYSKYSDASENFVVYINSGGKVKTKIKLSQKPKYVSANNDICVLFSNKIITYSLTKGEKKDTYKCDDSISAANKFSSKIFVTRHQLVDVIG